ncbi:TPA: hypothetical protein I8V91_002206 [Corynebacterium striatum]|uniref:hypothetical protein n=1 Tax=Corynebacterium striatum TaxID=43770 RepID=UPI001A339AE1|nr:hypothetical protein [Corynebacterium striatum]HAT1254379.1 hypothetical protein [Corynebacterium striatum]HAT1266649.1 hypothetical protein [Corynebacterium striatum]HAT1296312.1 hypothetical protein [Corynebacterium striatum]HAT1306542.1 hypothetical protein [Corynebacterium striatum]
MTAYTANTANAAITANTVATAQGVSKSFSRKTVLDGVNIQLAEGCIYGLVGRNGHRQVHSAFAAGRTGALQGKN